MTASNGFKVRTEMAGGKPWVVVYASPRGSPIAFEDLYDVIRQLVPCEVEAYDGRWEAKARTPEQAWARWSKQFRDVVKAAFEYEEAEWDPIADRFKLRRRDGTKKDLSLEDSWFPRASASERREPYKP